MSKIFVEPFRFSDYRALKVNVYFDYAGKYDSISLSFRCEENDLEIISTSVGQIRKNQVLIKPVREAQIHVDHCNFSNIQCIIGYYEGELLRFSDILVENIQKIEQIKSNLPNVRTIQAKGTFFDKRLQNFVKSLETLRSDWEINLEYTDDMTLVMKRKGTTNIVTSLGEVTNDLRASDYVFNIDPEISVIHIPKEIVSKTKSTIMDNSENPKSKQVAIFELVTPDFVELQCFYKIKISNTILLSEIK